MTGIGTIVNTLAVIGGGIVGLLLKSGLQRRFQDILMHALGLSVLFIGISGGLRGILRVSGEMLETGNILMMIVCLILGALLGEWINFDRAMNRLGEKLQGLLRSGRRSAAADRRQDANTDSDLDLAAAEAKQKFVESFVTVTLITCTGAMAIVGSFEDALLADPSTLYAKSALDAILVMIFASAMGVGALFSALPLALYQGGLTALAHLIKPVLTDQIIFNLSFIGSLLICCIGLNMLCKTEIKIGNFLPALLMVVLYSLVF